ncbi:MAG: hypothetical protein Q9207_006463 [Kuettlingeria erythrocarpa]
MDDDQNNNLPPLRSILSVPFINTTTKTLSTPPKRSSPPKPNRARMTKPSSSPPTFESAYPGLLFTQAALKDQLALLFRENRRLRALLADIPASSIPIAELDNRVNKNAPQLKTLVDPADLEAYEDGKMDAETFNGRKILGAMDIDCVSLEGEIEEMEEDNERMRRKVRRREQKRRGEWKGGDNIVDMVEDAEDEVDEKKVERVPGEEVIDFGFEGGKKVSSGVERNGVRGLTGMGSGEEEEDEVVGSEQGQEKEMAAIREKLRKVAKAVAGVEKDKITMEDVEEKLKNLERSLEDVDDAGASRAEECKTTDQKVKEMEEELVALQRECAE